MEFKFNNLPVSQNRTMSGNGPYQDQWNGSAYYSKQQQIEAERHGRMLEREVLKSHLRQEEQQNRQLQKVQSLYVVDCSEGIILCVKNAADKILRRQKLFDCQVTDMICFKREGTNILEWQVKIRHGDRGMESELYPVDYLESVSKLKRTILGMYDCAVSSADRKVGWDWMQRKLSGLFKDAEQIVIPSLPGWFLHGKNWHFWVHSEKTALLEGEIISRFTTNTFTDVTGEEVLEGFSGLDRSMRKTDDIGVLLIFRLLALLAHLVTNSLPVMHLVLVGNNAVEVARHCLRTMDSGFGNYDVINLDADSMARIEKCVLDLQDTPLIVVSSGLNSRSSRNRLEKVKAWLESGHMEGKRNTMPFIFCLREYSPQYLLRESLVIYSEGLRISENLAVFDKLQFFVISKIESGGIFWIDELKTQYQKEKNG